MKIDWVILKLSGLNNVHFSAFMTSFRDITGVGHFWPLFHIFKCQKLQNLAFFNCKHVANRFKNVFQTLSFDFDSVTKDFRWLSIPKDEQKIKVLPLKVALYRSHFWGDFCRNFPCRKHFASCNSAIIYQTWAKVYIFWKLLTSSVTSFV